MKKITHVYVGVLTVLFYSLFASQAMAYTQINSQLDLGERNSDVTSLQGFFADNSAIYPEGLVTGYFGGLTRAAILRFQAAYSLDQVGRVGPMTRDKINMLIASGGWIISDISGPWISYVNKTISSNSATFTWNTDEMATAKIFYYTSPVALSEGDINSTGFGSMNGYTATNDSIARTSQQVTLINLQPNTTYYYTIVSTDSRGNVSVYGPNNTFHTSY